MKYSERKISQKFFKILISFQKDIYGKVALTFFQAKVYSFDKLKF